MHGTATNTTPAVVRQGDILLIPAAAIPAGATLRLRDAGRVVLAYGEVTGHAHAILEPDAALLDALDGLVYLRLDAVSQLLHEEHATLTLAPGSYEVRRQREYQPERNVYVAD